MLKTAHIDTEQAIPGGYTRISDQIIDRWMPRLSGARFKIVMYIARRTYGFGKGEDAVSISQMVHGIKKADGTMLDEGTGLSRSTVIAECAWLASRENGSVLRKVSGQENGHHKTNRWALNLAAIIGEGGKGSAKSAGSGGEGSLIIEPPSSDHRTHNKQLDKKQIPPLQKASLLHPPRGIEEGIPNKEKGLSGEARGPRATSSSPTQPTRQRKEAGQDGAVVDLPHVSATGKPIDAMTEFRRYKQEDAEEKARGADPRATFGTPAPPLAPEGALDGPVQNMDRTSWRSPYLEDRQTLEEYDFQTPSADEILRQIMPAQRQ